MGVDINYAPPGYLAQAVNHTRCTGCAFYISGTEGSPLVRLADTLCLSLDYMCARFRRPDGADTIFVTKES